MGKTKLMYEFAKLTRETSSNDHRGKNNVTKNFSCDLILSSARILSPGNSMFDLKLDLRDAVRRGSNQSITDAADEIYKYLEDVLVTNRSKFTSAKMKKTHVFLFDEAQKLLETHHGFQAFLFRCIRTWLRKKRSKTTVIAVFSGTTSAILNYTIPTDLLKDEDLEVESPSRGLKDEKEYYSRGMKSFNPFFTLTTVAVWKPKREMKNQSDYSKSIHYGRPLFAIMHENDELDSKIETIVSRLLLSTGEHGFDFTQHAESWLSVLATRVQMGSTNISVVSNLVAKGYANLTGVTSNNATFVYMPDPVCARLAMCMMDKEWKSQTKKFECKSKNWWSERVKTLYSTGLCIPSKGDLGEVLTALYFLFCGDECRKIIDETYRTFSVPLGDWIDFLTSEKADATIEKQSSSGPSSTKRQKRITSTPLPPTNVEKNRRTSKRIKNVNEERRKQQLQQVKGQVDKKREDGENDGKHDNTSKIFVNFIQVCRDYLRAPWVGAANQVYLKNLYDAGTAVYTYPGCDLIDLMAPTVIIGATGKTTYSAVLVSIKSRMYFAPGDATNLCLQLKKKADASGLRGALCIVCIFGQTLKPDYRKFNYDASKMLGELNERRNVATVLQIPRNDRFGLSDIFVEMTTTPELSEVLSSHSFLRAWGQKLPAKDALRWYDENKPREGVDVYDDLTKDLYPEEKNQSAHTFTDNTHNGPNGDGKNKKRKRRTVQTTTSGRPGGRGYKKRR